MKVQSPIIAIAACVLAGGYFVINNQPPSSAYWLGVFILGGGERGWDRSG